MGEHKTLGLCRGRHDIPGVEEYIFDTNVDPLDTKRLYQTAMTTVPERGNLDLYVTGLSVALLAVVGACEDRLCTLRCWHYVRDTGSYYPQTVLNGFGWDG